MTRQRKQRQRDASANTRLEQTSNHGANRRRIFVLVLVLGVLLVAAVPIRRKLASFTEEQNRIAADLERQAKASFELPIDPETVTVDQMRSEAEQLGKQLLQDFGNSPQTLHIVASLYSKLRQYQQAAELWQRAIALAGQYPGPRAGLAMTRMDFGENEQAVEVLFKAIEDEAISEEIYQLLADALQRTGQFEKAQAAIDEGLRRYPDAIELWVEQGQVALQSGNLERAKTSYEKVLELQPSYVSAHAALSTICARLGDLDRANEHRRRYDAIRLQTTENSHRFQVIYESVMRSILISTLLLAGHEYESHGETATAEQHYLRAAKLNPNDPKVYLSLANLLWQEKRYEDAYQAQRRLVILQPQVAQYQINFAGIAQQTGRLRQAETALRSAARLAPNAPVVRQSLVAFYMNIGQPQNSRVHAQALVKLDPTASNFRLLASICEQLGDQAAASEARSRADEIDK